MQAPCAIDELLPEVLTYAPDCPEPVALRFIRDAARDFCERTSLWRDSDEFQVSTPDCEGLCSIPDSEIHAIEWASLDGYDLEPVTVGWLDRNVRGWADYTQDAAPARYVTAIHPDTLTVAPKVTGLLKLRLVLVPSRRAATLPSFLVRRYSAEIGRGASGRVLQLPGTGYENARLGAQHIAEFEAALDTASAAAARGQLRAPRRSRASFL